MLTRRGAFALVPLAGIVFSAALLAQGQANNQANQKKLSDAQKKEMQAIVTIVDGTMAGQPTPNDLSLAWVHEDLLKATSNREYVPFTVTFDPSRVTGTNLSIYWRVATKDAETAMAAAMAPPANGKKDDKNAKNAPRPTFSYEDIGTLTVTPSGGPIKLSRSFTVPAGNYDVFVLVKEPTSDKKGAPAPKMSVIKQAVNVPELWNEDLTTSSVIVAERIDPLPAPLTSQQMVERPYALGVMEFVPVANMKFTKKTELQPFLLIYNAKTDAENKPDVTVDFNFYTKEAGGGDKFFNKTKPTELNKQTLPPQFDFAAGHQLQAGVAVPLASFAEGDYRLEIVVTDKIAQKSVTRNVNFSVSGS